MDTLAENLFVETIKNKVQLNNEIFTSMIKCYYRSDKINKAWELYEKRYNHITQEDDMLLNTMINICAATHDAEKAKHLYDRLLIKGIILIRF
jgi:pentatricopeptide repeat protein